MAPRSKLPGKNKFLKAQEERSKSIFSKKNNNKKAEKVLTVKANAYEISKLRYSRLNEKKQEILKDKTINSKQKELYLKILDKQIDAVYQKYASEKKKRGL